LFQTYHNARPGFAHAPTPTAAECCHIKQRVVAVFQVKHDTAHPVDDLVHQYHYVGVAPEV
jgi:hypothetical protein